MESARPFDVWLRRLVFVLVVVFLVSATLCQWRVIRLVDRLDKSVQATTADLQVATSNAAKISSHVEDVTAKLSKVVDQLDFAPFTRILGVYIPRLLKGRTGPDAQEPVRPPVHPEGQQEPD